MLSNKFFLGAFAFGLTGALALGGCGSTDDAATGASSGQSSSSGGSGGQGATSEWDAVVLGKLKGADPSASRPAHDALAKGGEAQANAAGDFAHRVGLGFVAAGNQSTAFFAIDRWHADNMDEVYGNPQFQKAFGALFDGAPTLDHLLREHAWATWGDVGSADASAPHFFVVVRGHLKDPASAQATHDAAANAGHAAGAKLGDVAHAVFRGRDDATLAVFLDVWTSGDHIAEFYANPDFQKTFAALFQGAPEVGVYQSTDWYQW